MVGNTKNEGLHQELLVEDETYNDLLIGKPIDDYYNLSLKIVFLLAWTKSYCPSHWLLYIDDDTIVNVKNAVKLVASKKNETDHVIHGQLMSTKVIRKPDSRWFVPTSVWASEYYPQFFSGNGYLIPSKTLSLLHQTATNKSIEPKLWIDDVFITGITTNAAKIKLIPSSFRCCLCGDIRLFNKTVILGQMGKRAQLITVWKSIRGNWSGGIKVRSPVLTTRMKTSRFNRQGYLVTQRSQNRRTPLQLIVQKYILHSIYSPLLFGVIFLTIIAFLRFKKRLFFRRSAKIYLKNARAWVLK